MSAGGAGSAAFQPADEGRHDAGAPRYVLDPACGTCGFLAEAYERMKDAARTIEQR